MLLPTVNLLFKDASPTTANLPPKEASDPRNNFALAEISACAITLLTKFDSPATVRRAFKEVSPTTVNRFPIDASNQTNMRSFAVTTSLRETTLATLSTYKFAKWAELEPRFMY